MYLSLYPSGFRLTSLWRSYLNKSGFVILPSTVDSKLPSARLPLHLQSLKNFRHSSLRLLHHPPEVCISQLLLSLSLVTAILASATVLLARDQPDMFSSNHSSGVFACFPSMALTGCLFSPVIALNLRIRFQCSQSRLMLDLKCLCKKN